ncbi:MAG: HNH endonuclease [Rudanella sp.]|nr:HNH endonuclease [Rudanella sp.]
MANISATLKARVISRSQGYCEYCKSPADFATEPFSIEHIMPRSKKGPDTADNLAFACIGCNVYKSDMTEYIDVVSGNVTTLFNPRTMPWNDHFLWDETLTALVGQTPVGRVTIEAIRLNRTPLKNLRRALIAIGEHPPVLE